ncbi:MAG: antitoxin Xre/MbcA/ParS toxin-binding domain-containing protein [Balneolaceae bacterium]|nr:antitoxin Xre/MbcA/ParS toxin-binding domain-containing protein [Balneolaceae bacterium]
MGSDTTYTPREAFQNIFQDEGIQYPIENEIELVEYARKGVTKGALKRIANYSGLSIKELASLFPVSERTLHRYQDHEKLSGDLSERTLLLGRIIIKSIEVFGSKEEMSAWLHGPVYALGHRSPLRLMDSVSGMQLVLDILGRIEHGVYS